MISKVKNNPTDSLGVLVGGIVQILAAMGIFAKLEMTSDQIAQVGSGLFMVAAAIRFMLTKQKSEAPVAHAPSQEMSLDPEANRDTVTAPPPKASDDSSENTPNLNPPAPVKH